MKIIKKEIKKDNSGTITMKPTEEEDTWYLYNLIKAGDSIKLKVPRKVKIDGRGDYTVKKIKKTTLVLYLKVLKVDFQNDEKGTSLSLKTKNLVENEHVMIGQIQNVTVAPYQNISVHKHIWLDEELELLAEAEACGSSVDVMIMLYDDGYAGFYSMKKNYTKNIGKLQKVLPKKQKNLMEFYNNAITKFDIKVIHYIFQQFEMENIKVFIIGGPGIARRRLLDKIKNINNFEKDLQMRALIEKHSSKFFAVQTSTTYKNSINEILNNPSAQKQLGDTKALKEASKLTEFFSTLEECEGKAVYGETEVFYALEEEAIRDLLITDQLLRSTNYRQRKKYLQLVEDVKNQGGLVNVFHVDHTSGQKLKEITGLAAILRYELNLDELRRDQEDEKNSEYESEGELVDLNDSFIQDDLEDQ